MSLRNKLRTAGIVLGLGVSGVVGANSALNDSVESGLISLPPEPKLEEIYRTVDVPCNINGMETVVYFVESYKGLFKGESQW